MKICDFCRVQILDSGSIWGKHQDSYDGYKSSESKDCVFCTRIVAVLDDVRWLSMLIHRNLLQPGRPVYRWTFRKAAQIKEMPESFIITFREIPAAVDEEPESLAGLPDLTFYMLRETDIPDVPSPSSKVGDRTSSSESMEQVRKWVTICEDTHGEKCRPQPGYDLVVPTRLIDVGDPNDPPAWPPGPTDRFKLVETAGKTPERYVTLSHCWGRKEFAKLLKTNVNEFKKKGISWSEICRNTNFRDAIEVARCLRIRYIWIDSLCIIQDSEGHKDWEHEAPLMHMVYRNSYCNIAASDSADSDGGLFRFRASKDIVPARYPADGNIPAGGLAGAWRIVPADLWDNGLLGQVLYGRGWVFQERMLAPRAIHFTSTQVFWDCRTHSACESLPRGLPRQIDHLASVDRSWREQLQPSPDEPAPGVAPNEGTTRPEIPYEFWKTAVRKYTACALTFHGDKLKALWGIAQLVKVSRGDDFIAGLWGTDLVYQLAWTVVDPDTSKRPPPEPLKPTSDNKELTSDDKALTSDEKKPSSDAKEPPWFPSWSWASVIGEVEVVDKRLWDIEKGCYMARGHDGQDVVAVTGTAKVLGGLPEITKDKAAIALQCHRGRGTLTKAKDGPGWVVEVLNTDKAHASVSMHAFPDVSPTGTSDGHLQVKCEFLILAAGEMTLGMQDNGDIIYGPGGSKDRRQTYSGIGLLVTEDAQGSGYVQRTGAIKFRDMAKDSWERLCRAFGQDDGILSNEKGEKLYLV